MTVRKLAKYCQKIDNCERCKHIDKCAKFKKYLQDFICPATLLIKDCEGFTTALTQKFRRIVKRKENMERLTNSGTKEARPDVTIRDILNKLAEYEDLYEQGKMLKLPCAVGDTVYRIVPKNYRKIAELKIREFVVCENGLCFRTDKTDFNYSCDEFGEYIFLTREEAEQSLKR